MRISLACTLAAVCLLNSPSLCQQSRAFHLFPLPSSLFPTQHRPVDVDDPADEERLNRELWETMKGLPYSAVSEHLVRGQREAVRPGATVDLPNGWKLAPAGAQVEVGRLPYA